MKKNTVDVDRLAEALEKYGRLTHSNSGNFSLCCPWHQDSNPSCTVFIPSGTFFCWTCHANKPKGQKGVGLLKGLEALGVPAEERRLIAHGSVYDALIAEETFEATHSIDEYDHVEIPEKEFVVRETRMWPENWSYRGIRPTFLKQFNPSLSRLQHEHLPRLEIPLPANGPSIFVRLSSSVEPKSLNAPRLHARATIPFGTLPDDWKLRKECKGIIIVEGAYDALKLAQHVEDHFGSVGVLPIVALLGVGGWGAHFKDKFLDRLLSQFTSRKDLRLFIASDADEAGEGLAKAIVKDLVTDGWYMSKRQIKQLLFPRGVHDPGELVFRQFQTAILPQLVNA